jgi:phage-related protein
MPKTVVEFFVNPNGKSPVREFIDSCPDRQQVKILRFLQHLQEFGLATVIPNTKKLKGTPLWELRILGKDNIRIIYAPLAKNAVVVLHVFVKKTRRTPRKEISTAMKRYQQLLDK